MDNNIRTSIRHIPCLYIIKNYDWCYFYLNRWPNSKDGGFTLTITSSFGTWSHGWASPGGDPIAFLKELHKSYLLGKLAQGKTEFNCDQFQKAVQRQIIEERRNENIDAEEAREAWDYLLEVCEETAEQAIPHEIYQNGDALNRIFGQDGEYFSWGYDYDRSLIGWYKYFWSDFIANLHQFEPESVTA